VQVNAPSNAQSWVDDNATAPQSAQLVWRKILSVGIIAWLIIAFVIVPLTRGRIQLHGHLSGGGIALAVIGVVALLLFLVRSHDSQFAPIPPAPAPMVNTDVIPLPPGYAVAAAPRNKTEKSSASGKKSDSKDAKATGPAELPDMPAEDASPETKSAIDLAAESRPAWTKALPHREGDSYFVVVQSQGTNPIVREQILDEKMVVEANRFIDEMLYRPGGVAAMVGIESDYLRNNCLKKQYPTGDTAGSDTMIFAQLEFDNHFKDEVDRRYRQFVSLDRVQQLGGIALGGFALLGGLYSFLRLTPRSTRSTDGMSAAAQPCATAASLAEAAAQPMMADYSGPKSSAERQWYMHWVFWIGVGLLMLLVLAALGLVH
jgi:hypothetical protein